MEARSWYIIIHVGRGIRICRGHFVLNSWSHRSKLIARNPSKSWSLKNGQSSVLGKIHVDWKQRHECFKLYTCACTSDCAPEWPDHALLIIFFFLRLSTSLIMKLNVWKRTRSGVTMIPKNDFGRNVCEMCHWWELVIKKWTYQYMLCNFSLKL